MTPAIQNHQLPLVLLGGTLCNGRLWQPVLDSLNASYVISITLDGKESAQAFSQRLLGTLPPRFCLAGFSLGAIVALQVLADAPERVAGLALLSVNPLADDGRNAQPRRDAVAAARKEGLSQWLSRTLWPRYVAPAHLENQQLYKTIVQMAEESGFDAFAQQTEVAISRKDNRAALAAFTQPTLIVHGAHDPICTPQHHQLAFQAAPNARLETFSDCGHFLPLEAPSLLADALRGWLKEILE